MRPKRKLSCGNKNCTFRVDEGYGQGSCGLNNDSSINALFREAKMNMNSFEIESIVNGCSNTEKKNEIIEEARKRSIEINIIGSR